MKVSSYIRYLMYVDVILVSISIYPFFLAVMPLQGDNALHKKSATPYSAPLFDTSHGRLRVSREEKLGEKRSHQAQTRRKTTDATSCTDISRVRLQAAVRSVDGGSSCWRLWPRAYKRPSPAHQPSTHSPSTLHGRCISSASVRTRYIQVHCGLTGGCWPLWPFAPAVYCSLACCYLHLVLLLSWRVTHPPPSSAL